VVSAIDIIKQTTEIQVARKRVILKRGKKSSEGVGIILNLKGDISGKVVYEFSRFMTMRLSNRMLKVGQIEVGGKEEFKALLESAILELGNMITGNALGYLQKKGFDCDISTPRFYMGKDVDLIPFYFKTYAIDFSSNYGDFTINLSLNHTKNI
jgi:chemotaxis protein CheX